MVRVNWGQAAGEALLVVAGILLALAADAWWDERSERLEEQRYLAALEDELQFLRSYAETVMRDGTRIESSGRELLTLSSGWATNDVSTDSLSALVADLAIEIDWSPPMTVYQDLLNTGAVRVIRSRDVRQGLTEIMAGVSWVGERRELHNQFFWDRLEPYLRRHVPLLAVFEYPELPPATSAWSPDDFVPSMEFRNIVAAKVFGAVDVRSAAQDLVDVIDRVLNVVEGESAPS